MNRLIAILAILLLAQPAFAAFDVETGVITNERWRSGVPLGGIGCGKLEILPDGSFGSYTGNHNWDRPTGGLKGAFAAVFAQAGSSKAARMLRLGGSAEYSGVENIDRIDYAGWFPTAELKFSDAALPVKVSLLAWSLLIPHNAADSSLPVGVFRFKVTNPGKTSAQAVLLMSWPNLVGWGGNRDTQLDDMEDSVQWKFSSGELSGLMFGSDDKAADLTALEQNARGSYLLCADGKAAKVSTLATYDASSEALPFWNAFKHSGSLPVMDVKDPESPKSPAGAVSARVDLAPGESGTVTFILVWYFPDHITVHKTPVATGEHIKVIAGAELAFDGNPDTRWSTNANMQPGDAYELDLGAKRRVARVVLDSRKSVNDYPRGYSLEVSMDGSTWSKVLEANASQAAKEQANGLLDITFPEHEARYIRITQTGVETWFWSIYDLELYDTAGQKLPVDGWKAAAILSKTRDEVREENVGHYYSNRFTKPEQIAHYVFQNQERLLKETQEWHEPVRKSNLPAWLKLKMINSAFPIYACSVLTKDGRFVVQESPVDMGGATGTMDQRMAAHAFYTQLFPDLDETELRIFAKCQDLVKPVADGRITHFNGNIHQIIGDPNVGYGITDWPDLSASWIMQVLKLYRWTGDREFLNEMWPHVRRALQWLASADYDGDHIPEGGSTYDYETLPRGAFIYNASCYLGALRAGMDMARIQKDSASEKLYQERFDAAQANVMKTLWNGKYFIKHMEPKTGRKNPNSFIAQLAGDWLSRLSCSGRTLSPDVTDSAIREVIARHVKAFYPVPPMEVTPEGKLATRGCYVIQHEPYAGCEAINEGYTDDGLEVIKRIYDIAWYQNRNPWHEPLSYDAPSGAEGGLISYMTCPATWHVLNALSGSTVDVPAETLYLSPKIGTSLKELHMPVYLSRFWLWVDYLPGKQLKLKVLKAFGAPVSIREIVAEPGATPVKLSKPFVVKPRASLDLSGHMNKLILYPRPKTVKATMGKYTDPKIKRTGMSAANWRGESGLGGEDYTPTLPPFMAYDADPLTRWTTGRPMLPGDWVLIDLGKKVKVSRIVLDSAESVNDYPRGCTVYLSNDGKKWTRARELSRQECESKQKKGVLEIGLSGESARFIKIVQNGEASGLFWSVHELYIYE